MKRLINRISSMALCGLAILATNAAADSATPAPDTPKSTAAVLDAMSNSSTWGHEDEYGEFNGMQRYAAGNYQGAMKYFLIGARYADKLSQLSIGLMYLNGEGVEKDPATAFAWIAIASERKYPQFLATRDALWAQLDATQRKQAKADIEKLYPEYGDPTAQRRMANQLRWNEMEFTGSMLGFGHDSVSSLTPAQFFRGTPNGGAMPACGGNTIGGAPITGCGNLYADWRWNPKVYFKVRDAEWTGKVTVGALQPVDSTAPSDPKKDTH